MRTRTMGAEDDFEAVWEDIEQVAETLLGLDVEAFLQAITEAEQAGPVLAPELYEQTAVPMRRMRRVVAAAAEFKATILKIKREAEFDAVHPRQRG